jgi:hypothetical protein
MISAEQEITMILALAASLLIGIQDSATMLPYADSIHKYTLEYPSSWEYSPQAGAIAFLSPADNPDDFREYVHLQIQDLTSRPMTLAEYTDMSRREVVQYMGDSSIIYLHEGKMNGFEARDFFYQAKAGGGILMVRQQWFMRKNQVYIFTYAARPEGFEQYLNQAMNIISSFNFTDIPALQNAKQAPAKESAKNKGRKK